jgi:hypothetical protein
MISQVERFSDILITTWVVFGFMARNPRFLSLKNQQQNIMGLSN